MGDATERAVEPPGGQRRSDGVCAHQAIRVQVVWGWLTSARGRGSALASNGVGLFSSSLHE